MWMPRALPAVILCCLVSWATATGSESIQTTDVLVYGGTPAGIAAALAAAGAGDRVELVEPYAAVGGMVTNGLSHPDFRTFEGLSGSYLDMTRRVRRHYADAFGKDSPQVEASLGGTQAEPKVSRLVLEQMLADRPEIAVRAGTRLVAIEIEEAEGPRRIVRARFESGAGEFLSIAAKVYIDATYEGDLMAAAGDPYRIGREGRDEHGESLAPAEADGQVQGYNFRLTMTQVPENRVPPVRPPGYRRDDFLELLPLLESGSLTSIFAYPSGGIYKAQIPPLPNGKHDINDVSHASVRLSLPGTNTAWPDGDVETRRRIFDEHLRHNVGMLYFLQTDADVPRSFQEEALRWGFCRDEHTDSGHLPEQLYVREARRMVGLAIFTERDTDHAPGDARSIFQPDSIAAGDYGPNCHGTDHEGSRFGGRHTGEFYKPTPPYQIPYGVIVSRDTVNLLVPVAASSSHVGFCALRLEPIWTSMGQAAGHAARLALKRAIPVADVSVTELQRNLHADGSATIYVSDVPPGSPDFAAVQWWGTASGLHGLAPTPETPGRRGPNIIGQYFEAFPDHAAELDRELDETLRARWLDLVMRLDLPSETLHQCRTRGEFIREAFSLLDSR